jgi:hypothetical protein
MLIEEGKLRLDEPVDRLLPELSFRLGLGVVLASPGAYLRTSGVSSSGGRTADSARHCVSPITLVAEVYKTIERRARAGWQAG